MGSGVFCSARATLEGGVIVIDLMKDVRGGYESARRVPIVMVSSSEEHPAERFAGLNDPSIVGPDVYLKKPLEVKGFVKTVRSLLKAEPATQV